MDDLSELNCVALSGTEPMLSDIQILEYNVRVPDWKVKKVDGMNRLERVFKFKNFAEALAFTDRIGMIAEEEDHHPLIITEWGKVTVNWWTHKIGGLHLNDFIMAAKTDELFSP